MRHPSPLPKDGGLFVGRLPRLADGKEWHIADWQRVRSMKNSYQKPAFTKRERLSSVTASPNSSGLSGIID